MATRAYAALVSVVNLLTRFKHRTCPVSFDRTQLKSLRRKVRSLVDFLESYSPENENLLREMAESAFAAEDSIETYYVEIVLGTKMCQDLEEVVLEKSKKLSQDLKGAIHGMDLILQHAKEVRQEAENDGKHKLLECSVRVGSVLPPAGEKAKMVGFEEELLRLMDELTSDKRNLQIIPVVGMGGIGKTTFVRHVYDHKSAKDHFYIRAWVTISQDYSVLELLKSLLDVPYDESKDTAKLGERLHKKLFGRKYLIVLDDMWDNLAWDKIGQFFPNNGNSSRILLTTRNSNVALSVGSCSPHNVMLLDDNKSWDLLYETVFGQEVCPSELVECGKKIARGCKGLPLAVTVVGGVLRVSERTLQYWEHVAENVKSFANTGKDRLCLDILSLSYKHLPIYLKPCCLYFATFKEDSRVNVSNLIKLWVGDGFLKPCKGKTMEEVALEYLNLLIDRNLIMVGNRQQNGEMENCIFHDFLREFCLEEALKEKFFYELKKDRLGAEERLESQRRLVHHSLSNEISHFPSMPLVRSFSNLDGQVSFPDGVLDLSCYRLLRVLATNRTTIITSKTPLVNLRYLTCKVDESSAVPILFSSPSLFWNLETLDIFGWHGMILPFEIWELVNLRHLSSSQVAILLPEPANAKPGFVLDNLQSLVHIRDFIASNETVEKIPQLKRLVITYYKNFCSKNMEKFSCYFTNLARLHKLERLSCSFLRSSESRTCVFKEPKNLTFPPNLRELYIGGSSIPWENMTSIGSLPNLEILTLGHNAFCGAEWNSTDEHFRRLKHLSIGYCDLLTWKVESNHFPSLEQLELLYLKLKKIPLDIGEVTPLRKIRLDTKKMAAVRSAKRILELKESLGEEDLLIEVTYEVKGDEERDELNEMECKNFRVEVLELI